MATVRWQGSPFYGSTSRPVGQLEYTRIECLGCGSSLAGRSQGLQRWGPKLVRVFACPCGRRRRVEVPAR